MDNYNDGLLAAAGLAGVVWWARGRSAAVLQKVVAAVAGLCLILYPAFWVVRYWPFDIPYDAHGWCLGYDFNVHYCLAKLAPAGGPALYDLDEQHRAQVAALGGNEAPWLPSLYPPFVAAAWRPLGWLGYKPAYFVFAGLSALLMALTAAAWFRRSEFLHGPWRTTALLVFAGCPLFWMTLFFGQAAPLGFASFGLAAAWCLEGPIWCVPIAIALAAYKPPALALVFLGVVVRWPRLIPPTAALVAGLVAWGGMAEGWDAWKAYVLLPGTSGGHHALTANLQQQVFHGLAYITPWTRNLPSRWAIFAVGLAAALLVARRWRQFPDHDRGANAAAFGLLGTLGLTFNPYVPIYDLVILLPIVACAAEARLPLGVPASCLGLALLYFGPELARVIGKATDWQVYPLLTLAFAAVQWRAFFARPIPPPGPHGSATIATAAEAVR